MKHIVQLSTVHDPDDSRVFHKICKSLVRAGYFVTYVVPADRDYVQDGVHIKALPRPKDRLERFRLGATALRMCLNLNADLYHFHDPELLPTGCRLRRISSRPVIFDVHEYFAKGLLSKPWLPGLVRRVAASAYPAVERYYVKRLQAIIAVNDDLAESYHRHVARSISVYNYPDITDFFEDVPSVSERARTSKVLLYLGSINQDRGLETLLDTILIVRTSHPDAILRIVGNIDPKGLTVSCRQKLEQLRGSANFDHIQSVPYSAVGRFLQEAAIGLIPLNRSVENEEGIPRKMFEYMLFALPVIASDFGRIARVVKESNGGLVAAAEDPRAFAAAVDVLFNDPALQASLGANGRDACLTSYTWTTQKAKLLRLYDELLPG